MADQPPSYPTGWLTVKQAARRLEVDETTIREWCDSGRMVGAIRPHGPDWLMHETSVERIAKELEQLERRPGRPKRSPPGRAG